MLVSDHLKFDVDNEVDALSKAKLFVAEVCEEPMTDLAQSLMSVTGDVIQDGMVASNNGSGYQTSESMTTTIN